MPNNCCFLFFLCGSQRLDGYAKYQSMIVNSSLQINRHSQYPQISMLKSHVLIMVELRQGPVAFIVEKNLLGQGEMERSFDSDTGGYYYEKKVQWLDIL